MTSAEWGKEIFNAGFIFMPASIWTGKKKSEKICARGKLCYNFMQLEAGCSLKIERAEVPNAVG